MPLTEDVLTAIKSYKQIDPAGASHILCVFKQDDRLSVVGYHNECETPIVPLSLTKLEKGTVSVNDGDRR